MFILIYTNIFLHIDGWMDVFADLACICRLDLKLSPKYELGFRIDIDVSSSSPVIPQASVKLCLKHGISCNDNYIVVDRESLIIVKKDCQLLIARMPTLPQPDCIKVSRTPLFITGGRI